MANKDIDLRSRAGHLAKEAGAAARLRRRLCLAGGGGRGHGPLLLGSGLAGWRSGCCWTRGSAGWGTAAAAAGAATA